MKCYGGHTHDQAMHDVCYKCNKHIVKLVSKKTGKTYAVDTWTRVVPSSGTTYTTFTCWENFHVCDEQTVQAVAAAKAHDKANHEQQIAIGNIVKGQTVVVVSKRSKIAFGTVGVVRWIGYDAYDNERVGIAVEGLDKLQYLGFNCVVALPAGTTDALVWAAEYDAQAKAAAKAQRAADKAHAAHVASVEGQMANRDYEWQL